MDGRVQLPVIDYLRRRCDVDHVDTITEPGPVKILAEAHNGRGNGGGNGSPPVQLGTIRDRLDISIHHHGSRTVAVVAHDDCAGNPVGRAEQLEQLARATAWVREHWPQVDVIGLWVDADWRVEEIPTTHG